MNPRRFAVAPMMRYSHRHGRMLWRLLCPPALLYTEMTVAAALARGAARTIEKALAHSPAERPLALQVAGADAAELARAATAGEGAGFCEINLNCGCPSERAGAGGFGACMMSRPARVAECVAAMKAAVSIPITVKCRLALIGADGRATGEVETLARAVFAAGCDGLIVHARAAVLGGLSPAQNRAAPPLDYDRVARLKRGWRDKAIWLNGGIGAAAAARRQLRFVDGVMAGRAATRDPLFWRKRRRRWRATRSIARRRGGRRRRDFCRICGGRSRRAKIRGGRRRRFRVWRGRRRGRKKSAPKSPPPTSTAWKNRFWEAAFDSAPVRRAAWRVGALDSAGLSGGLAVAFVADFVGLWLAAAGMPAPKWIFVFVCGAFVMRSFGCVVNDWADRKIDRQVRRTRARPLATGEVAGAEAALAGAILLAAAFALFLALPAAARWWALAALAVAVCYPFAKRFMRMPQLVLGLAFSMGIPTAYATAGAGAGAEAWILVALNAAWVVAYDTIYAMIDRDDDIRAGINSSAIVFGRWDVLAVAILYVWMLCGLSVFGVWKGLGWPYYVSLSAGFGYVFYLHRLYRRREDRESCRKAFARNHWLGAIIFAGIAFS